MDIGINPNYYFGRHPYKPKLICCDCRKVFKRKLAEDLNITAEDENVKMICPNCGKPASYVGPKFRAPKIDDLKAWRSIEVLNQIGVLHFTGFATNRITIPESKKALFDLLSDMKIQYENAIRRWVSHEYNEGNKKAIKAFSDIVKRIDKQLDL